MKSPGTFAVSLLAALGLLLVPVGSAVGAESEATPGFEAIFNLRGSNGYSITVVAYSEREDGKGYVWVAAHRRGGGASYRVPATVTAAGIDADLGRYGKIEVARHPSGREKKLYSKCLGSSLPFEPATYEGILRFRGEGGYVRADQTTARERPWFPLGDCSGRGKGESIGGGLPGARLTGVSHAHGRILRFQLNKNRPRGAKTVYSASLRERRGRVGIYREVSGVAGSGAFTFDSKLRRVRLRPPAPFSGRAVLRRPRNSVLPVLGGSLAIHFPGRTVHAAGRGVAVSVAHAKFTVGDSATAEIEASLRLGRAGRSAPCRPAPSASASPPWWRLPSSTCSSSRPG